MRLAHGRYWAIASGGNAPGSDRYFGVKAMPNGIMLFL